MQEQIFTGYMGKLKKLNMTFMGKIIKLLKKNAYISTLLRNTIKETPEKLIIISGFSGVGKGTVIHQLLIEHPEKYVESVSATTRKPRKGEVNGNPITL